MTQPELGYLRPQLVTYWRVAPDNLAAIHEGTDGAALVVNDMQGAPLGVLLLDEGLMVKIGDVLVILPGGSMLAMNTVEFSLMVATDLGRREEAGVFEVQVPAQQWRAVATA